MRQSGSKLAVLILAAGASRRLGRPKQLLLYEGKTLLEHAATHALALSGDVFVVLGHSHDACTAALNGLPVTLLHHSGFEEGMGSSIAFGIGHLHVFEHVLIMLSDQPLIPRGHYLALKEAIVQTPGLSIASFYHGTPGVPAVFPRASFASLEGLRGDRGAKPLLSSTTHHVPLESRYAMDIDTEKELALLREQETADRGHAQGC